MTIRRGRANGAVEQPADIEKGRLVAGPDGSKQPRTVVGAQPVSATIVSTRAAVIHQVKADEPDAVLLIVPEDNHTAGLVDAWVRGDAADNEGLRVSHVAATRARRLLAIAVPEGHHGRLVQHLASRGVPLGGFSAPFSQFRSRQGRVEDHPR